jgi:hypothetical protein
VYPFDKGWRKVEGRENDGGTGRGAGLCEGNVCETAWADRDPKDSECEIRCSSFSSTKSFLVSQAMRVTCWIYSGPRLMMVLLSCDTDRGEMGTLWKHFFKNLTSRLNIVSCGHE